MKLYREQRSANLGWRLQMFILFAMKLLAPHRKMRPGNASRRILSVIFCLCLTCMQTKPALASDMCNPPSVIPQPVCDMDSFHGSPPREVPNGWTEFVTAGDATFYQADHSYF